MNVGTASDPDRGTARKPGVGRHLAGVAVRVRPERFDAAYVAIDALPGVEVHLRHPDGERLVAVVEADDVEGQVALLRRIRAVHGVLVAAPTFHMIDDGAVEGTVAGDDGVTTT